MREWQRRHPGYAAASVRARRDRDPEGMRAYDNARYANDPEARRKRLARSLLIRAVNRGQVVRGPCELCGDPNTEGHHGDYGKPLEVRWLCPPHHVALHLTESF